MSDQQKLTTERVREILRPWIDAIHKGYLELLAHHSGDESRDILRLAYLSGLRDGVEGADQVLIDGDSGSLFGRIRNARAGIMHIHVEPYIMDKITLGDLTNKD